MTTDFKARVLVVEDEEFTLNLLPEVLEGANFQVEAVKSVAEALALVASFDPHVAITDLNFGVGPRGADLLQHIEKEYPWVGKVVLNSHASPALAIPNGVANPTGMTYLVKSELGSINKIVTEVEESISHSSTLCVRSVPAVPQGGATWKFLEGIAEMVDSGQPVLLAHAMEELG